MAYAEFLGQKEIYHKLPDFYQNKRNLFLSLVKDSRFKPIACHGTFFQMLDYSEISDTPDVEFSRQMTLQHGVAAIPPSVFYHRKDDHKVLRFCFAKRDETLQAAAEKLCRI